MDAESGIRELFVPISSVIVINMPPSMFQSAQASAFLSPQVSVSSLQHVICFHFMLPLCFRICYIIWLSLLFCYGGKQGAEW